MNETYDGMDITHLPKTTQKHLMKKEKQRLEHEQVLEYKQLVKKIPNDIILHQAMQVLYDEYIYKNKKVDYHEDDFRDLLRNSEEMMHGLETLYHIEKAKRLEWV